METDRESIQCIDINRQKQCRVLYKKKEEDEKMRKIRRGTNVEKGNEV